MIYEGLGEGPDTAKDRMHFTLKPLGPGQKYSFRIRVGSCSWLGDCKCGSVQQPRSCTGWSRVWAAD